MEKELTGYPSIDKPWLKYYSEDLPKEPLPECTIYEYLYDNNHDHMDDIAIIYFNRKISYGELFDNIDHTEKAFRSLGVKAKDIVTVAMPSLPEALYCVYALNKIGAIANMIHPLASKNEICNYLNEVQSGVCVMFTGTYELVRDSLKDTSIQTAVIVSPADSLPVPVRFLYRLKVKESIPQNDPVIRTWKAFLGSGKNTVCTYSSHNIDETAIISHTGGTTGEPKGVMASDRNINSVIWQIVCNLEHSRGEVYLSVLPPFINYSLVNSMLEPLAVGISVVLVPQYDPDKFDEYIRKYRPNYISSMPLYWEALLNNKRLQKEDLSCLKNIFYGGDVMNAKSEEAVNALIMSRGARYKLAKGYGSTELVSAATVTYDYCNDIGSIGIPLVKMNCKIVEPGTLKELSYNEDGELCITGPSLMIGYYEKPEATNDVIKIHDDGNRWLHTGDLGHITEDGIIYVTGRIKRIILTKGKDGIVTKLFPDRIEKAILEHPSVGLCCVIGVKDDQRVHYPKAVIVLNNEYKKSEKLTNEILAICKEKLPDYMIPEIIEYRDDLPRTSRGKVDYRTLEQEANGN